MEQSTKKRAILIYTEDTPNPETIKYVTNNILYNGTADFNTKELADEYSALASFLYQLPYVKSVYISQNFVSVTKEFNFSWEDIMLKLKEEIKNFISEGHSIVDERFDTYLKEREEDQVEQQYSGDDKEIVIKIKELIDKYVKPAVEMDGGNIEFHSWNDGKVTVLMQGSCSGCPSSTVTLKSGIEGMLKRMVPEVTEVISVAG